MKLKWVVQQEEEDQSTHAVKADDGYILNGVKTYTSMSKALTHIIVAAYIEELESVGFS